MWMMHQKMKRKKTKRLRKPWANLHVTVSPTRHKELSPSF
jgi:hypothetical protein